MRRDWKHIVWPGSGLQQLVDLHNDPGEIRNLAGQAAQASRQSNMQQQLDDWRRRAR